MNFEQSEQHTDTTFHDLPKAAQQIVMDYAVDAITEERPTNWLVQRLDSCILFRCAINEMNFEVYPQEVDVAVRWFKFHYLNV